MKISFTGTHGEAQDLFYFTTDLSNWGIQSNPGFMAFCERYGQGNGFAKAASYLMHLNEFSKVRDFLLERTRHMIEDDSGIPYRHFASGQWMVSQYGNYPGPIPLFKDHFQKDLSQAFKTNKTADLPFGVGYQWRPGSSSLVVATALRDIPKAQPVSEAEGQQ